jgi:ATP-dependent DNA helicase RecG
MPSRVVEKVYLDSLSREYIGKIVTAKIKVDCVDAGARRTSSVVVYGRSGAVPVEIRLFNYKKYYARRAYRPNEEVFVSGKLGESMSGMLQFINPEKLKDEDAAELKTGFYNIYPLTAGVTQTGVYSATNNALKILSVASPTEWIPGELIEKNEFPSFYEALRKIHQPKEFVKFQLSAVSRRRICFDELLAEQLALRLANRKTKEGNVVKNEKTLVKKLLNILSFSLTDSQRKVIEEIFADLKSGKPMARLLQGDVGSGKTIVAIITALYVIESGYQCAILAPTEILARQHYAVIGKYLEELGIQIELLTSNDKGKRRKEILNNVENATVKVLVGTHAIIMEKVNFQNLGLVIVDEQHRFGVSQRLRLINKGNFPHVLSMTATPIPRTIVMSLYGDISVSTISEKPIGRKDIITKAIPLMKISSVVDFVKRIIENGQKAYWVCPLIEESEKLQYACVINRFDYLKNYFGDGVAMLHGKMKSAEKQDVFERFKTGDCHILVSTTVVEVGVDVSNASAIIIENAEKFGLAQLHQLRGRVGRSDVQSYCILLYDHGLTEIAKKRLNIMRESADGFFIAEQDLLLRGGGEVLGTKQSGRKTYKTFDMNEPNNQPYLLTLLKQASELATKIVDSDDIKKYETLLKIFSIDSVKDFKQSF